MNYFFSTMSLFCRYSNSGLQESFVLHICFGCFLSSVASYAHWTEKQYLYYDVFYKKMRKRCVLECLMLLFFELSSNYGWIFCVPAMQFSLLFLWIIFIPQINMDRAIWIIKWSSNRDEEFRYLHARGTGKNICIEPFILFFF